jgi:hypothetical protein
LLKTNQYRANTMGRKIKNSKELNSTTNEGKLIGAKLHYLIAL